ncbi:hypothetical protein IE00_18535 [Paracoccus sp. SM22M-07]|nr:hypothetical protein IE00_18535 [Paracoccus sp. SM22M-07]
MKNGIIFLPRNDLHRRGTIKTPAERKMRCIRQMLWRDRLLFSSMIAGPATNPMQKRADTI